MSAMSTWWPSIGSGFGSGRRPPRLSRDCTSRLLTLRGARRGALMIVLSYGMTKSASSFAWLALKEILRQGGGAAG